MQPNNTVGRAVCVGLGRGEQRRNPVGVGDVLRERTQGSLALLRQKHFGGQATLGWRTQSLWDWNPGLLSRGPQP
jgi:hypothetical protein